MIRVLQSERLSCAPSQLASNALRASSSLRCHPSSRVCKDQCFTDQTPASTKSLAFRLSSAVCELQSSADQSTQWTAEAPCRCRPGLCALCSPLAAPGLVVLCDRSGCRRAAKVRHRPEWACACCRLCKCWSRCMPGRPPWHHLYVPVGQEFSSMSPQALIGNSYSRKQGRQPAVCSPASQQQWCPCQPVRQALKCACRRSIAMVSLHAAHDMCVERGSQTYDTRRSQNSRHTKKMSGPLGCIPP